MLQKATHTVLIVEDQAPDMALVKNSILSLWPDCKIVSVCSLNEAYTACQHNNFDMVLLDLNLPDGTGAQTVADMRKIESTIPIVVITGHLDNDLVYRVLKNGANSILPKENIMTEEFCNILEESKV